MSTVKLNVARDQLLWSWISNGHGGAEQLPPFQAQLKALLWEGLQPP